jgi:carbamate kinase
MFGAAQTLGATQLTVVAMKLVIAIGGNALLRPSQAPSADNLLDNVRAAAAQIAKIACMEVDQQNSQQNPAQSGQQNTEASGPQIAYQIVLTHGSGPQVGVLALQAAAYAEQNPSVQSYPLDMLDAEVAGMLGYMLEQEIANLLSPMRTVATLLTRVEVARLDPAFNTPTKPIGPANSAGVRRLVASPKPVQVLVMEAIRCLLAQGALVIAGGGGGIPVVRRTDGFGMEGMQGVEAVIDKDLCSAMIAVEMQADCLIIATDVDAVYVNWGQPEQRRLGQTTPQALAQFSFATGSMGPKVEAAINFVKATGQRAVIGPLDHIEDMLAGRAGTQICADVSAA